MDWIQVFTIVGILGGFIFFMLQRIERDIQRIERDMSDLGRRLDSQATRIDQSYKMFCDLLKERK
jgi:uncharacterized membrane-anchored protein YhcB (DUF1043 family)